MQQNSQRTSIWRPATELSKNLHLTTCNRTLKELTSIWRPSTELSMNLHLTTYNRTLNESPFDDMQQNSKKTFQLHTSRGSKKQSYHMFPPNPRVLLPDVSAIRTQSIAGYSVIALF